MRTVVIAGRDAPQYIKDVAHFVCTNDVSDIYTWNLATKALDKDGGVLKPYGTFDLRNDPPEET